MPSKERKKIVLLAGAVGVVVVVVVFFILRSRGIDPRQIGDWLAAVGDRWWAPLVIAGALLAALALVSRFFSGKVKSRLRA